ncbi:VOC family protein [Nocardia sp. R6R-6]|uniref:VOC family protein n=1 Tax=Nocardia sp. R6R-6 TaxID=3459303 RepID=UPI00403E15C7
MAIQQLAYAKLRVNNMEEALAFHTEVLGLVELARDGDAVHLGCGLDDGVDLVLTPGGTGVDTIALDVTSPEDLERVERRLNELGVAVQRRTGSVAGVDRSIAFAAPSGHVFELVVLEQGRGYVKNWRRDARRGGGVDPVDLDHISLVTPDVRALATFLREALDFRVSDFVEPTPGFWAAAWTRCGQYHHDIAIVASKTPDLTLHHIAWTLESMDHIKRGLDLLAINGHMIEVGPGRHSVGSNLFAYFKAPGGNRHEFSAEMPRLANPEAEPGAWEALMAQGFSAWGQRPPEGFEVGS